MAMVGWIRGYKTQGSARAVIEVPLDELYQRLVKRFLTPRGSKSSGASRIPEIQEIKFSASSGLLPEVEDDTDFVNGPLIGESAGLFVAEADGK